MEKLSNLAQCFVEDVNREDSSVIDLLGKLVDTLYTVFYLAGIPFFLYVLLQFARIV